MMKTQSFICYFKTGTINSADIQHILANELDFIPDRINFRKLGKGKSGADISEKKIADLLANERELRIDRQDFGTGSFDFNGNYGLTEYLKWSTNGEAPALREVEKLVAKEGFVCAYWYDINFAGWQDEKHISNYEASEVPYKHLKIITDEYGNKSIDISSNPAHSFFWDTGNVFLGAYWKMWFSKSVRDAFPGKPIEEFADAFKVKHLLNDVLFVQLYENIEKSNDPGSLQVMRQFREWVELDKLNK